MNFAKRGSLRGLPRLELTSMIDVIFLLLIYFVLSSTYQTPETATSAALRSDAFVGGRSADLTPQVVEVEGGPGGNTYRVGERTVRSARELAALVRSLPREGGVLVRGHPEASVDAAAQALAVCRDAGFARITYVPAR